MTRPDGSETGGHGTAAPGRRGTVWVRRLTGLAATLLLLGVVAGVPALLVTVGADVVPQHLASPAQVWAALTTRDDGTLALVAVTGVAWAAWLVLTVAVLVEVAAQARGVSALRLPGLRLPQAAAGQLVSATLLLFVAAPLITPAVPAAYAQPAGPPAPTPPAGSRHTATAKHLSTGESVAGDRAGAGALRGHRTSSGEVEGGRLHTVRRGESLWSIAADHLGSGLRYTEIAALNADTLHGRPGFLTPGQVLTLPGSPQPDTAGQGRQVRVQRGDTLSEIAEERLGDPDRYPEIFRASTATRQPDGRHLRDPDIIDVGWTLTVPQKQGSTPPTGEQPGHTGHRPSTAPRPGPHPSARAHDPEPSRPLPSPLATGPARPVPPASPSTPSPASASPASASPGSTSPTPTSTATSQPTAGGSPTSPAREQPEADGEAASGLPLPGWALTGLSGAGAVLASSLLLLLRHRRAAQFRARRPGRTIAAPPAVLAPVEKTLVLTGDTATPTVGFLDQALRRLAASRSAAGRPMPVLAAVELTPGTLTLHLADAASLSRPWQPGGDQRTWRLPTSTALDEVGPEVADQPAPYPLLVTVGATDDGVVWLLNCEQAGVLAITGDPVYSRDLARYLAAEIACNPWSDHVRLDCVGVADEVAPMNPERVRAHPADMLGRVAADVAADAAALVERSGEAAADVPTARAQQSGAEAWPARMLLLELPQPQPPSPTPLASLLRLVAGHPGRTGTALVLSCPTQLPASSRTIQVTRQGRLRIPHLGVDLVAVGLTADEAAGCAALLAAADTTDDIPVPVPELADAEQGWQAWADSAGAVRAEHTLPRQVTPLEPAATLLDGDDQDYLDTAATTAEDLTALAPQVPARVRAAVEDADPTLDADLEAWRSEDCDLPRLTLLGPVWARTHGAPLAKRRPFYTELLAYLATRPHGATPDEVAEAMGVSGPRVRTDIKVLRDWLGTNPRTGRKHLPDARDSDSARTRGIPTYQVDGLLVDADLFRRLRVRGETRGPEGIADLRAALTLVSGRPFDQVRPGGWTWMLNGDRLDQHLLCAIVDVAHLVTTFSLQASQLTVARAAAEVAILAAPFEEIPLLDLAAVAAAEGHPEEETQILHDRIFNRSDDGAAPTELPGRTQAVLQYRRGAGERAS